jgi:lysophospholipase
VEILREFLSQGASVHLRNREAKTPLFLAANAGLSEQVRLLREAGAHLHSDELAAAKSAAKSSGKEDVWEQAGIDAA